MNCTIIIAYPSIRIIDSRFPSHPISRMVSLLLFLSPSSMEPPYVILLTTIPYLLTQSNPIIIPIYFMIIILVYVMYFYHWICPIIILETINKSIMPSPYRIILLYCYLLLVFQLVRLQDSYVKLDPFSQFSLCLSYSLDVHQLKCLTSFYYAIPLKIDSIFSL